ncbi:hypothetical protein C0J52_08216 [Blattella germanica]|nr:hypothetical protein C0J52_08216 [Blattella germanica]
MVYPPTFHTQRQINSKSQLTQQYLYKTNRNFKVDDFTSRTVKEQIFETGPVRMHAVEDLFRCTDYFTWEDLPTKTSDGRLTNAGLVPVTQKLVKGFIGFIWGIHSLQSLARIIFAHDMVFDSWYPFDASSVGEAVYAVDWIGQPVHIQRLIYFMIANANSGLKQLSAARFVPVSKGTFVKFMNETMSLFMFLLQVQERGDG